MILIIIGNCATFFLLHGLGLNIFCWKPLGFCTAYRPLLGTINYWNWNALAYFHTTSHICRENTILFWKGFSGFLSSFRILSHFLSRIWRCSQMGTQYNQHGFHKWHCGGSPQGSVYWDTASIQTGAWFWVPLIHVQTDLAGVLWYSSRI